MSKIIAVQPENTADWRDALSWHFGEFTKHGDVKVSTLWDDIATKQRQLWVVKDGDVKLALLTRIADDEKQTCVVTHAAGYDRYSWLNLFEWLQNWASSIGCHKISVVSRPGWERPLKQFGLKKTHVVLEMDI